jgi:hypothetical protein
METNVTRRLRQPQAEALPTKAHRMSLRSAIDAKCRDCIHDEAAPGTWREQVAQCSCPGCPLWALRPAPSGGPFADPPRDPEAVSQEWLRSPLGGVVTAHPRTDLAQGRSEVRPGGAP